MKECRHLKQHEKREINKEGKEIKVWCSGCGKIWSIVEGYKATDAVEEMYSHNY